jgi:hypothetical protein
LNKKEVHETRISTTLLLKAGLRDNRRATPLPIVAERVIVRIDHESHSPFAGLQKTDQDKCGSEQVRFGVLQLPSGVTQRSHPVPHSLAVEQFLAMVRFAPAQRDKLAELPVINTSVEPAPDFCYAE